MLLLSMFRSKDRLEKRKLSDERLNCDKTNHDSCRCEHNILSSLKKGYCCLKEKALAVY